MSAIQHADPTRTSPGTTRVLLRTPDGAPRHVEVDWDDDVGGLAEVLLGARSGLVVDGAAHAADTALRTVALPRGARVAAHEGATRDLPRRTPGAADVAHEQAPLALEVVAGPGCGDVHPLQPGTHLVGRDGGCDVVLPSLAVSGHHAEVRVGRDGRATVVDLESRNGIAGGVAGGSWTPGTCRRLGDTVLRLVATAPRRSTPRVPPGCTTVPVTRSVRPAPTERPTPLGPAPRPSPAGSPRPLRWSLVLLPLVVAGAMAVLVDPRFALFAALGPVTAVGSWWEDRRLLRRERAEADADHARALAAWKAEAARHEEADAVIAWQQHPGTGAATRRAAGDADLWSVRPGDEAFGRVSVGVRPTGRTGGHGMLVPVVVDLANGHVLGLVGTPGDRERALSAILAQLATSVGPDDLTLLVEACQPDWGWLPHVPDALLLGDVELADGPDGTAWSVAVLSPATAARPEVRTAIAAGRLAAVVMADDATELSDQTTATLHVTQRQATVRDAHGERAGLPVLLDRRTSLGLVDQLRVRRAPDGQRRRLPDVVTLGTLLDRRSLVARRDDGDLRLCRPPGSRASLSACIGEDGDGPVVLDLVGDGPHALIGGTTGSGKSELLRSLVLALAVEHDAGAVQFVLVDFKGGATFDVFDDLPHTLALQTDLDGADARRTMLHLEAELRRREELLRAAGVADLALLSDAPPRLVVVIDELAAFLATHDRASTALADVAQRGRSLGVHLVLATQRPSGAIGPDIRANTALRIALRTEDETDARDVVDDPGPAGISRRTPGRAHVRTGGRLLVVQTAHTTAPAAGGCRELRRGRPVGDDRDHELDRLVALVRRAGIRPAPAHHRWPDPLPDVLRPTTVDSADDADVATLGLVDEPSRLRRRPLTWSLADGPLAIHGLATSGAVDALVAAAFDLASRRSPEHLHVEAVDVGAGALRGMAEWPHVAAVHDGDDREALERLLDRLRTRVARRRAGHATVPVLVLVDGLDRLRAHHDDVAGHRLVRDLVDLAVDGAAHGVHVAVTTSRPLDLPSALIGALACRLVLTLAEPTDHAVLGMRLDDLPVQLRGRGYDATTSCHLQITRVDAAHAATTLAAQWHDAERPPTPPRLPRVVRPTDLPGPRPTPGGWDVAVGLDAASLEPVSMPVVPGEHLLVVGPARSGRTTLARRIGDCLAHPSLPDVHVLTRRPEEWAGSPHATVVTTPDDLPEVTRATLLVVEDAARHPDHPRLTAALDDGRVVVLATGRPGTLRLHPAGWLRRVRVDRLGALLRPTGDADGSLLDVVVRGPTAGLPDGRGYLVRDGDVVQTQFVLPTSPP